MSGITPKPGPQGDAAADPESVGLPLTALTGMLLAASLAPLGSTMIAIALPGIGRDIGAEVSDLTPWLVSSYLIASIALQSPGGKPGYLIGHGHAIVVGLSIVALGSVIGSFGSDAHVLGAARIRRPPAARPPCRRRWRSCGIRRLRLAARASSDCLARAWAWRRRSDRLSPAN